MGKGLLLLATPWPMLSGPSFPSPSPLLLQHCWWEVVECRGFDLGRLDANLSSALSAQSLAPAKHQFLPSAKEGQSPPPGLF